MGFRNKRSGDWLDQDHHGGTPHTAALAWPGTSPILPVDSEWYFYLDQSAAPRHQCALRGRRWQTGQVNDDRFMNASRRIGAPQRGHGRSSCP